ncbi:hypothetical protein ABZ917_05695 [Nonomuraea wenchangensis]
MRSRVAERAGAWALALLGEDEDLARLTAIRLVITLYPGDHGFNPPPGWWQTPLGQVMVRRVGHPAAESASYAVAGAMHHARAIWERVPPCRAAIASRAVSSSSLSAMPGGRRGRACRRRRPAMLAVSPATLLIPGTRSVAHLEENLRAWSIELTDDDLAELDKFA